jgi:Na+/melibiose symporter-like transporter
MQIAKARLCPGTFYWYWSCFVLFWGFDSLANPRNSTNTPFSLLMLAVTYSIIPAMFKFVAMPLLWNYPLTEERVADVQAQILTQGKDRAEPQQHS